MVLCSCQSGGQGGPGQTEVRGGGKAKIINQPPLVNPWTQSQATSAAAMPFHSLLET